MKKTVGLHLLILAVIMASCKDESTESPNLEVNSSALKSSGLVSVSLENIADTSSVCWSIAPSETAKIVSVGSKASIAFSNEGHYTLSVKKGVDTYTTSIEVDSVPATVTLPTIGGKTDAGNSDRKVKSVIGDDKLLFTPFTMIDSVKVKALVIDVVTTKSYVLNESMMHIPATVEGNLITIRPFITYVLPYENSIIAPLRNNFVISLDHDGVYKMKIEIDDVFYYGELTLNSGKFTIKWDSNNPVVFTKLVI